MANIAFVPVGDVSQSNYVPQEVQIPPYDDQGVSFKGYSKQLITGNQYKLRPQRQTSFYMTDNRVGFALPLTFTRPNAITHDFYCTGVYYMTNIATPTTLIGVVLYDNVAAGIKFYCNTVYGSQFIPFIAPLKFTGNILYSGFTGAAGEFTNIVLVGWEEEK